jgi:hypothetical protein
LGWEISTTLGQLAVVPAALLHGLLSQLRAAPVQAGLAA